MNKEVIQWDYKGFKYGDFGGFEDATNELKKLGVPERNIKLYWYGKTKNNPQSAPNKENRKCEILIHK